MSVILSPVSVGGARTLSLRDGRSPLVEPAMSNAEDRHERLRLTSRWLEIGGKKCVPVTGEIHFSRIPRERWDEELRLLVASGLTSVSTYLFWIHHEPVQGELDFGGNLDIAHFLDIAETVGIDVIVRIGPWCHGEVRNGGHPDWVVDAVGNRARTNDPEYLALVANWYEAVAQQIARFCGPDRPIVGIQLENELYDQPEHFSRLKALARQAGLSAPLWTATAWGGAVLPPHEVFPLYGGYADGFWAGQGSTWDDSFRDHFRFTHEWDDPGVGGDFREQGVDIVVRAVDPEFPPSTCELGGGMATAYHRRPIARGLDIAAVANVKIGNGSAWQGFYMYAGGVNPRDHLQESHATGYPNDLPRFDYDFQAVVGATGRSGPGLGLLRDHNAFLSAFGEELADMYSSLPDDAPVDVHDLDTLRWAVRSNADSGFLFINTHEPHEPLQGSTDVQFRIPFESGDVLVPDHPIEIPSGLIARWPLNVEIGQVRLEWATASVAGLVDSDYPTLVLRAHDGVAARVKFASGSRALIDGAEVRLDEPRELAVGGSLLVDRSLRVLVVDEAQAQRLWYLGADLIDSTDAIWRVGDSLVVRSEREPTAARWNGERFVPLALSPSSAFGVVELKLERRRECARPPERYGSFMGRSSAPNDAQFDAVAAVWRVDGAERGSREAGELVELVIDWAGDVAHLCVDGQIIGDRFWDGLPWRVDITDIPLGAEVTLHIAPITSESVVDLDAAAAARVQEAGMLCSVNRVDRVVSVLWS